MWYFSASFTVQVHTSAHKHTASRMCLCSTVSSSCQRLITLYKPRLCALCETYFCSVCGWALGPWEGYAPADGRGRRSLGVSSCAHPRGALASTMRSHELLPSSSRAQELSSAWRRSFVRTGSDASAKASRPDGLCSWDVQLPMDIVDVGVVAGATGVVVALGALGGSALGGSALGGAALGSNDGAPCSPPSPRPPTRERLAHPAWPVVIVEGAASVAVVEGAAGAPLRVRPAAASPLCLE